MSSWIEDVRSKYGNGPMLVAGTGVIVWRKNALGRIEILLQKRNDIGKYGLFGGALELGEHGETCAARELWEEAGIVIPKDEFEQVQTYVGKEHHTVYPNNDEVYHLVILYSVEYYGDVNLEFKSSETKNLRWISINQLRKILFNNPEEIFFHNNIPILWDVAYKLFD